MKRYSIVFFFFIVLVSCNNNKTNKIERKDEPAIYGVTDDDVEMNEAIKTANQTLDNFNKALKSSNPDYSYFALKTRFNTPEGGEHIWVSGITLQNNKYFGLVDNLPESTTEIKLGETIEIRSDNISDWMYIDKQKLQGGYTIKLLRKRMTEAERKQFDTENGLIIED